MAAYDPQERRALVRALARLTTAAPAPPGAAEPDAPALPGAGTPGIPCPTCGGPVALRPVPPGTGRPYVRRRFWVTCPSCGRGTVVDRAELEAARRTR